MEDRSSFYCIIGAGPVGLSMARALKKARIPYEQLEADADVGGNWRHGVYPTAHIISSRKTTQYSDYPMPSGYPDFPSAEQMRVYLSNYAAHFGLREHIQFKTAVSFCRPLPDHRWEVQLSTGKCASIAAFWYATVITGTAAGLPTPANSPANTSTRSNTRVPSSCAASACW